MTILNENQGYFHWSTLQNKLTATGCDFSSSVEVWLWREADGLVQNFPPFFFSYSEPQHATSYRLWLIYLLRTVIYLGFLDVVEISTAFFSRTSRPVNSFFTKARTPFFSASPYILFKVGSGSGFTCEPVRLLGHPWDFLGFFLWCLTTSKTQHLHKHIVKPFHFQKVNTEWICPNFLKTDHFSKMLKP